MYHRFIIPCNGPPHSLAVDRIQQLGSNIYSNVWFIVGRIRQRAPAQVPFRLPHRIKQPQRKQSVTEWRRNNTWGYKKFMFRGRGCGSQGPAAILFDTKSRFTTRDPFATHWATTDCSGRLQSHPLTRTWNVLNTSSFHAHTVICEALICCHHPTSTHDLKPTSRRMKLSWSLLTYCRISDWFIHGKHDGSLLPIICKTHRSTWRGCWLSKEMKTEKTRICVVEEGLISLFPLLSHIAIAEYLKIGWWRFIIQQWLYCSKNKTWKRQPPPQ